MTQCLNILSTSDNLFPLKNNSWNYLSNKTKKVKSIQTFSNNN
jgi:hypothetical protein